jgi:hypothetical protein
MAPELRERQHGLGRLAISALNDLIHIGFAAPTAATALYERRRCCCPDLVEAEVPEGLPCAKLRRPRRGQPYPRHGLAWQNSGSLARHLPPEDRISTDRHSTAYLPGPTIGGPPLTLFGPDISNNNFGGEDNPDLAAAAAFINARPGEGFSWVEAKSSQGSDFIDPTWATVHQTATAINLPVVAYHYLDTTDATAQAQTCLSALNGAQVPVMFDFEDDSGDFDNFQAVQSAFKAAGLNVALSYLPQWYWEDIDSPDISGVPGLVSSAYPGGNGAASTIYAEDGGDSGEGWDSYGGATPVIWQFTDQALIAGLDADCNAFIGELSDLQALLGIQQEGLFSMLTEQQQQDIYNMVLWTYEQVVGILANNPGKVVALPGSPTPTGTGWPQLGKNSAGESLTLVDAVAALQADVTALQALITSKEDS